MEMTDFHSLLGESTVKTPELDNKVFGHPDEVLEYSKLSIQEKRALLASWASDANGVANLPWLRQLPDGSIVKVDEILRALKNLDHLEQKRPLGEDRRSAWPRPFARLPLAPSKGWRRKGYASDDDDDPPPMPAAAARKPRDSGGGAFAIAEPAAA